MTNRELHELIALLDEYSTAKFGDEWWPGSAGAWIGPEKAARLGELLETPQRAPSLLEADEIHVVLDCLPSAETTIGAPWDGYETDPDDYDPKTTEAGWRKLLASAKAKLEEELSRL